MFVPTRPAPETWTEAVCSVCFSTVSFCDICSGTMRSGLTSIELTSLRVDMHDLRRWTEERRFVDPSLQIRAVPADRQYPASDHDQVLGELGAVQKQGVIRQLLDAPFGKSDDPLAHRKAFGFK